MYKSVDSLHHYNLVVIIGTALNVASEKAKNYTWYIKGHDKLLG